MCSESSELLAIVGILKKVITILQIGIPIVLFIFGTIDLGKAVMAGDEKEIKGAVSLLIKRLIAALGVFLLFMIISVVTGWVGSAEWRDCWSNANPNSKIDTGI